MKVFNLSFLFTLVLGQYTKYSDEALCIIWSDDLWVSTSVPADLHVSAKYWDRKDWDYIDTTLPTYTCPACVMGEPMYTNVTDISCTSTNDCWAVTSQGLLYYFGNIKDASFPSSDLKLLRPAYIRPLKTRSVSVADDGTVWVITPNDEIYRKGKYIERFDYIGLGLDVAAINYSEALIVGQDGQLYHYNWGNWALNSRLGAYRLKKVSRCANNEIWAIRNDGGIWRQLSKHDDYEPQWGVDTTGYWHTAYQRIPDVPHDVTDIICKDNRIYHAKGSGDVYIHLTLSGTFTRHQWWKDLGAKANSLG